MIDARPPLYEAQASFGPWKRGSVFESTDPYYEGLAREGRLLVRIPREGEDE